MKKEFIFLQISRAVPKEAFLQHITELAYIEVVETDSYEDLFTKLRDKFKDILELSKAAEDWIQYQYEGQEDKNIFKNTKLPFKSNTEFKSYAIFNIIDKK